MLESLKHFEYQMVGIFIFFLLSWPQMWLVCTGLCNTPHMQCHVLSTLLNTRLPGLITFVLLLWVPLLVLWSGWSLACCSCKTANCWCYSTHSSAQRSWRLLLASAYWWSWQERQVLELFMCDAVCLSLCFSSVMICEFVVGVIALCSFGQYH